MNYLVAYCKPNAVSVIKIDTEASVVAVENVDTVKPEHNESSEEGSSEEESSEESSPFYCPLPARDVLGLQPGELYKGATKRQYVHSSFSHYMLRENHYRLSDEDAIALMMNECHYLPKSLLLHEYEVMQWTWSHDALLPLLTRFFSKLESLSVKFRTGKDLDYDYTMVGIKHGYEDMEVVLAACFSSPLLTSVYIEGVHEEHLGSVLASTLSSSPCPSLTALKVLHGRGDAKSCFEALATIIASHSNLSELSLYMNTGLTVSVSTFSYLYALLINFVQKQEFSKLIIGGLVPGGNMLQSLLEAFLNAPCSHPQEVCLQHIEQDHNVATSTNLPVSVSLIDTLSPSGALEYKSLFVDKYSILTVEFCEWLFSHQPLVLKAFHFNALLVTGTVKFPRWYELIPSEAAAPIHLLSDNASFCTQDLSLLLVGGLPNKSLQSVLHGKPLRKLSLAQKVQVQSYDMYSIPSLCNIGDVADILSLKLETLTELTISLPTVSIGSSADVERFGDTTFSLSNYEEFSLNVSVFWRKGESKYIKLLYSKWLKYGRKKMKSFQMGVYDFDLTDEIHRMLDEMGLVIGHILQNNFYFEHC